jgi:hypothetical protein
LSNRAGLISCDSAAAAPLSDERGTEIREEVAADSLSHGVVADSWEVAVEKFDNWYDDGRDSKVVVENLYGETTAFRTPNRFTPEYREMLYAKAQSLERGLRERWGRLLHTGMLTLTCSTTDQHGQPRPPVDHLNELLSSWESVRRALYRVLDDREWEYLAILEPHESGYAHVHLGVFVKGPVVAEQFQPVIDAHLRNCEGAGRDAHQICPGDDEDDGVVSIHRASHPSHSSGVENLGAYLAAYMAGEYGREATEMPENVRRFYATMWATGRQWFRPSNGAQELMKAPEGDDDDGGEEWELVGIQPDGDDGDLIKIDPDQPTCVRYVRVGVPDPPPIG